MDLSEKRQLVAHLLTNIKNKQAKLEQIKKEAYSKSLLVAALDNEILKLERYSRLRSFVHSTWVCEKKELANLSAERKRLEAHVDFLMTLYDFVPSNLRPEDNVDSEESWDEGYN